MSKLLFTPGPLTTHENVKRAMLRDLGSREESFTNVVGEIRRKIIEISRINQGDYEAVLISGSGTSGIEAVLSSISSDSVKWLVISNGRYGERMVNILNVHGIPCEQLCSAEDQLPEIPSVENVLKEDRAITHVAIVHCETTTGIINDIEAVGKLCDTYGKTYFVDAMSSFGAIPIDFMQCHIDFLVSSPNKCLESVPGFSFVIAKRQKLEECEYRARTVTLNLHALWQMQKTKEQFCFTPPVQVLLAFQQALMELEKEGGFVARSKRYKKNHQLLVDGMIALGFDTYLAAGLQGPIITAFNYPTDFQFEKFYADLHASGFIIYPGILTEVPSFRVGTIGCINSKDIKSLLSSIKKVLPMHTR